MEFVFQIFKDHFIYKHLILNSLMLASNQKVPCMWKKGSSYMTLVYQKLTPLVKKCRMERHYLNCVWSKTSLSLANRLWIAVSHIQSNNFSSLQQWRMSFQLGLFDRAVIVLLVHQSLIISREWPLSYEWNCKAYMRQLSAWGTYYRHLCFIHWLIISTLGKFVSKLISFQFVLLIHFKNFVG